MEEQQRKALNSLIRQAMPKVVDLMASQRKLMGDAHVTECQRRGMAGEPGWFYARQGVVTVGAPWADVRALEAELESTGGYADAALVMLRPVASKVDGHGAH